MPKPMHDVTIEIAVLDPQDAPRLIALKVQSGTSIEQALVAAGVACESYTVAINGVMKALDEKVMAGDRIDLLPPLNLSPEAARKLRAIKKQKAAKVISRA